MQLTLGSDSLQEPGCMVSHRVHRSSGVLTQPEPLLMLCLDLSNLDLSKRHARCPHYWYNTHAAAIAIAIGPLYVEKMTASDESPREWCDWAVIMPSEKRPHFLKVVESPWYRLGSKVPACAWVSPQRHGQVQFPWASWDAGRPLTACRATSAGSHHALRAACVCCGARGCGGCCCRTCAGHPPGHCHHVQPRPPLPHHTALSRQHHDQGGPKMASMLSHKEAPHSEIL